MLQTSQIENFLSSKIIAIVGVSRKKDIPANAIFKKFNNAGYRVFAINPNASEIDGFKCYPDVLSLPAKPEGVFLASTPDVSERVVKECISLGIKQVWMHRGIGNGSYSEVAHSLCRDNDIDAITNGCPMMFIKPIDPFHRILRWLK